MKTRWPVLASCFLVAFAVASPGQAGPVVQVDFSNPGLSPSHWTLILHPDGSGHFHSERGNAPTASPQASDAAQVVAPDQDRDVHLSSQFTGRVFQAARNYRWFNVECESHLKVAFQGTKKLSYNGPDGQGSCVFNFAKDKDVQALTDSLVAVAGTIVEGGRLEVLLQHDPLGLDRETEYLVEAAGDGRAEQIGAIRGILERLADDDNVMERVRRRVRVLLAMAEK